MKSSKTKWLKKYIWAKISQCNHQQKKKQLKTAHLGGFFYKKKRGDAPFIICPML